MDVQVSAVPGADETPGLFLYVWATYFSLLKII